MSEELMNTATTDGEISTESTEQVATGDTAQVEQTNTAGATETTQEKQERLFKQSELDSIIQQRLAKEKQRFDHELKSHPTLSYLEQKAQKLGMSVEQLIENDRKYDEQQKINELIQKNIPPEIAQEVYEGRKFRETYTEKEKQAQQKEQQTKMFSEFLEAYPEIKPETIPQEVWQSVNSGEKLLNAYARYENKLLKEKLNGVQQQQQTIQANEKNAASSTGSVRTAGATGSALTDEMVANMSPQELANRWPEVRQLYKMK